VVVCCAFVLGACVSFTSPDKKLAHIREEMRAGQLDVALRDGNAALAAYQSTNPEWAARFRVVKARILMIRGSYSDSLRLALEPLPPSLRHTETEVEQKMAQGLDYDYLQQFDLSDQALSQAESLAAAINSSFLGSLAQSRGILEVDRRNYAKADLAFHAAAAYARDHHQPRAEIDALGDLGNVSMWQEHYDEAADRFKAALEKSRALGVLDTESRSLGNLGWSYLTVGDFDNAELSFKDAQVKAGRAGLVEDQTYWLVALTEVYLQQGRYLDADSTGKQALALAEQHDDKNTLTTCLNNLTQLSLATGRLDDAEKYNRRALEIENAGLDQFGIVYSQLFAGRIALGKQDFPSAESAFRRLLADPLAATPLKWEAHARLAQLFAAEKRPDDAQREFDVAIRTVQQARSAIESNDFRVSFLSSAIEFYDAYVNFLIARHRDLEALRIADLCRALSFAPDTSTASAPKNFSPQAIARRTNATLLFYWLGRQNSWLWVISPKNVSLRSLPAAGELSTLVTSYRDSFTGPQDPREAGNPDGKTLYSTLIQPIAQLIPANSRVIILPDGGLHSLNFETLIVSDPQPHYWIEDATLITASSLSQLEHGATKPPPTPGTLLLIGEALPASPDFPPLPQAGKEVGLLEKYFDPSHRLELLGGAATPQAFLRSSPEKFSYLHFATHGTASSLLPLESAVILSPQGDSYKLYARDVVRHPLNAYLVTISACNGAGVKTYAGEGLVGLSWAFLHAGADNVIAGLWEVSNASTPQLMDQLYKGLTAGQDPATALRNAKLSLLHSTGNYRKPFYWAPFLLYSAS